MALDEKELLAEQKYLSSVFGIITNEIAELDASLKKQYSGIISTNKDFSKDVPILNGGADFDQIVEIYKFIDIVEGEEHYYNETVARLRVLRQMYESAYFGKIDFLEDGEKISDEYYIGISTLRDEFGDFAVLDWRAPICSIYYEYEGGKCSYECPAGQIDGTLLSKRQFGISKNEINFAFDTDVLIEDKLLCKVLSESRDKKMGHIVKSIQKEQNHAIRHSENKNLVIFGPAGSGKTSVAMHRAAFILYKNRANTSSKNILIISPNSVFRDYISDVLPDLGEENARLSTLTELFSPLLESFTVLGHGELLEKIINDPSPATKNRLRVAQFKNSPVFLEILLRYSKFVDNCRFKPQTVMHEDEVIITAEEISQLYYHDWSHMSYSHRLKRIESRARAVIDELAAKRKKELEAENADLFSWEIEQVVNKALNEEFAAVNSKIKNMFTVNTVALYADMFNSREFFDSISDIVDFNFDEFNKMIDRNEYFNKHKLYWEDTFPLLFVKCIIDGQTIQSDDPIKFLFIDEFQDIPPVGLYVLRKIFDKASFTLVGDINQTIDSTASIYDSDSLSKCLGGSSEIIELTKSYRSTIEISQYANSIISDTKTEYMDRHGDPVEIRSIPNPDKKIDDMLCDIEKTQKNGMHSIGIICRDSKTAATLNGRIKSLVKSNLILADTDVYSSGITVIPSYLAKGLEFDAVYVFDADRYSLENDRRLYYTVCTRAMHRLVVYGEIK